MSKYRLIILFVGVFALLSPLGGLAQEPGLEGRYTKEDGSDGALDSRDHDDDAHSEQECRRLFADLQDRLRSLNAAFDKESQEVTERYRASLSQASSDQERRELHAQHEVQQEALAREHRAEVDAAHKAYAEACRGILEEAQGDQPQHTRPVEAFCTDAHLMKHLERRAHARLAAFNEQREESWKRLQAGDPDHRASTADAGADDDYERDHERDHERDREGEAQWREQEFNDRWDQRERALRAELRQMEARFLGELEHRCDPDRSNDPGSTDDSDRDRSERSRVQRELALLQMDCELRAQRAHAQTAASDDEAQMSRESMRECRKQAEEAWQEHLRRQATTAPKEERFGHWSLESRGDGWYDLEGRYVEAAYGPRTGSFDRFMVGPDVLFDSFAPQHPIEYRIDRKGTTLLFEGPSSWVELNDDPTGLIRWQAPEDASFRMALPAESSVQRSENGYWITLDERHAFLRALADDASWDAEFFAFTLTGSGSLWIPERSENQVLPSVANLHRETITQAVDEGRLGAEVTVVSAQDRRVHHASLVYEDVDVGVQADLQERRVEVVLSSSTLEGGQVFVLNVDRETLDIDPALLQYLGRLEVEYFNVDPDSGMESAQEIRRLDSLQALLDDQGDTPAYWLVLGEDGVQLAVNIPHWSTHKFSVSAHPEDFSFDVPAPLGLGVIVGFVVTLARLRRRVP